MDKKKEAYDLTMKMSGEIVSTIAAFSKEEKMEEKIGFRDSLDVALKSLNIVVHSLIEHVSKDEKSFKKICDLFYENLIE